MIWEKEILWEVVDDSMINSLLGRIDASRRMYSSGIGFHSHSLKLNLRYDNSEFDDLLEEKFKLSDFCDSGPCLTFVEDASLVGIKLPYYQYGYVSNNKRKAVVFASSFGVFKSVISGFASFCLDDCGYVPVHASVLASESKGVILTGGTSAGKTTVLLNIADLLIKSGSLVKILTDDWAIVSKCNQSYIAETFDPSVSLKAIDLTNNPHLSFYCKQELDAAIRKRTKISMHPECLYGKSVGVNKVGVNTLVLLEPKVGPPELQPVSDEKIISDIMDAAYHYPYITDNQISRHRQFWEEAIYKLNIFSFATRAEKGGLQSMDAIRRML